MHIRYLMLDNGIEFQFEVVTGETWGAWKPKTVCVQNRDFDGFDFLTHATYVIQHNVFNIVA